MMDLRKSSQFNYWNFFTSLNGILLWYELTGETFTIDGGYIVAIGEEEDR